MRLALALALVVMVTASGCMYELADTENTNMRGGLAERGGMAALPMGQPGHKTWSQSGKLTTGDASGSVSCQTGDLSALGYATYQIQLGVDPPANGNGFNALATITYTVNGNPIVRKVSVGQGVSIQGPADSITVRVVDTTPSAYDNNGQQYGVTIAISPGTRASTDRPTLDDVSVGGQGTYVLQTTGATQKIAVPQGCGVIGAYIAAQSNSATSVTPNVGVSEDSSGVTTNLFLFGITDPLPHFIPIAPGVISLVAGNRDSTNIATLSVLWVVDG